MRGNKLYNAIAVALADSNAPRAVQVAVAQAMKAQNHGFKTQYFYEYIDKRRAEIVEPLFDELRSKQ